MATSQISDSTRGGRDAGGSIYGRSSGRKLSQTAYQSVLLRRETFRTQYNAIMCALTRPGKPATQVVSVRSQVASDQPPGCAS